LEWAGAAAFGTGDRAAGVGGVGRAAFGMGRREAGAVFRTGCRTTGDRRGVATGRVG
jgi:hypothetical protein